MHSKMSRRVSHYALVDSCLHWVRWQLDRPYAGIWLMYSEKNIDAGEGSCKDAVTIKYKIMTLKQGKETGSLKLTRLTTSPRDDIDDSSIVMAAVVREARVQAQAETFRLFPAETWSETANQNVNPSLSLSPSNPNRLFNTAATRSVRRLLLQRLPLPLSLSNLPHPHPRLRLPPPTSSSFQAVLASPCTIMTTPHLRVYHLLPYCPPFQLCFWCQSGLCLMRASVRQCSSARHDILAIAILAAALTYQSSKSVLRTSTIIVVTTITVDVLNILRLLQRNLSNAEPVSSASCITHFPCGT